MIGYGSAKFSQGSYGLPIEASSPVGYGTAIFSQGTYGKGVMLASTKTTASTTIKAANHVVWHSYFLNKAVADPGVFGGLTHGANSQMDATSTMILFNPAMTWDGALNLGTTVTVGAFGIIPWKKQKVSDSTWTTQTVD